MIAIWRRYVDNQSGEVVQIDLVRKSPNKTRSKLVYYFNGVFKYKSIVNTSSQVIIDRENYTRIIFTHYME